LTTTGPQAAPNPPPCRVCHTFSHPAPCVPTWPPDAYPGTRPPSEYQWGDRDSHLAHVTAGLPYPGVFLMYPRPHRIWVAGLVRQSAPADAIFDAGRELPVR
jgi:hypothetical protein